MVKFEKFTKIFLRSDAEYGIGDGGLELLDNYIESGFNIMGSGISSNVDTKLQVLSDLLAIGEFKQNRKGEYTLDAATGQVAYKDEYHRRRELEKTSAKTAKRTLPGKVIAVPWVKVLASLPIKEKDWAKVPEKDKERLAAALDSRIKKTFDFNRLRAKRGIPNINISEYLRLAIGDRSIVANDFCEHVYTSFRELRATQVMQANPKETLRLVLDSAQKQTRRTLDMHSPDRLMYTFKKSERRVPIEFLKIWREVKRTKAKSPAQWLAQLAKEKIGRNRKKTTKDFVEGLALRTISKNYRPYGINVSLKNLNFSDPYIARRTQEDPQSMKMVEGVYQKQLLKSFFDYLWAMKSSKSPSPLDFYHAALFAQTKASEKLHDSLPKIKQIMVRTQEQMKKQIKMVRRKEAPKRRLVA
jgi:hypothetical protein